MCYCIYDNHRRKQIAILAPNRGQSLVFFLPQYTHKLHILFKKQKKKKKPILW